MLDQDELPGWAPLQAAGHAALSHRTVAQLRLGEQLLLWAFRQRLADGGAASAALAQGFRLAFGPAAEAALAAFEAVFASLQAGARRPLGVCPLRCGCLSLDEERLLQLVTAAQLGSERALMGIAAALVGEAGQELLRRQALLLGERLREAEMELPLRVELVPAGAAVN